MTSGESAFPAGTWKLTTHRTLIPRSVEEAVQQRTAYLSTEARHLVTLAAVAGRRFNVTLLREILQYEEEQVLALLKKVMAAQLVVEEAPDRFAFRHALTQEAIMASLLLRERQGVHRRIAETLERLSASSSPLRERSLEDLAYHCYEAGLWEQALAYAQKAGEKALRLYAQQAAIDYFTRAIEATHYLSLPPPASLYLARGQAYETLGDFERARHDYEHARAAARTAQDSLNR
jgi:predicted ATPase